MSPEGNLTRNSNTEDVSTLWYRSTCSILLQGENDTDLKRCIHTLFIVLKNRETNLVSLRRAWLSNYETTSVEYYTALKKEG